MKKKIYIRADGSSKIGLGHLTRCTALAHMLKKMFSIYFVCREIPDRVTEKVKKSGFSVIKIETEEEFFSLLNETGIVVLDHYELHSEYQIEVRKKGYILVCIDDLHDKKFYADLIINHTPGIDSEDYDAEPYTKFALGHDYALLRPLFLEEAKQARKIEKIENVFICFGGSDYLDLTSRTIKVLLESRRFKSICVVVGDAYQHFEKLKNIISGCAGEVELHKGVNEKEMLRLMKSADIAIVPASGILLEALAVGSTIISGQYAENQKFIYNTYKSTDTFIDAKDFSSENIQNALTQLSAFRRDKKEKIDGYSDKRILRLFLSIGSDLREVKKDDCPLIFEWSNDKSVRRNAFNSEPILWEKHQEWYNDKLQSDDCRFFIMELEGEPIGQIRFDKDEDNHWVIDYSIDKDYRGCGLGTVIVEKGLSQMVREISAVNIKALVKEGNVASLKVFRKLKFNENLENQINIFTKEIFKFQFAVNETFDT